MAEAVVHVQAHHVLRVSVTLGTADVIQDLVVAALNTRIKSLGDQVKRNIMGGRIITSTGGFTLGDSAALVATVAVALNLPYYDPATNFLKETFIGGTGTAVIAVYYSGTELVNAAGTALVPLNP